MASLHGSNLLLRGRRGGRGCGQPGCHDAGSGRQWGVGRDHRDGAAPSGRPATGARLHRRRHRQGIGGTRHRRSDRAEPHGARSRDSWLQRVLRFAGGRLRHARHPGRLDLLRWHRSPGDLRRSRRRHSGSRSRGSAARPPGHFVRQGHHGRRHSVRDQAAGGYLRRARQAAHRFLRPLRRHRLRGSADHLDPAQQAHPRQAHQGRLRTEHDQRHILRIAGQHAGRLRHPVEAHRQVHLAGRFLLHE